LRTRIRPISILAIALFIASTASAHAAPPSAARSAFDPHNFPAHPLITNPYLPMSPGTTMVYTGFIGPDRQDEKVAYLSTVKVIDQVHVLVVKDSVFVNGALEEIAIDYFAQDFKGNVWYMGEFATTYQNGKVTGHQGSWTGGIGGAVPGRIMLAHPHVGDAYIQESLPGVAEDHAAVLSTTRSVCVPYQCFAHNVLLTKEWSPLDPGMVEHKFYAVGVGWIKMVQAVGTPAEEMRLTQVLRG
jgi:hypothetical protein